MKDLKKIKKCIASARSIIVAGHINPDGDTIGSALGLALALQQRKKNVTVLFADAIPRQYRNLPGVKKVKYSHAGAVDLAIAVDCSTKRMLGSVKTVFKRAKTVIEVDHHMVREPFATYSLVDPEASSVGEVVANLLAYLNIPLTKQIATNILTSVIVETYSFRSPHVTPETFRICSNLLKTGVDFHSLVDEVYWSRSKAALLLSGICMSRCILLKGGKLAWSYITRKDFKTVHGKDEDVDPVADELRSIKGVEVSILFREKSNSLLRVSLRSKGNINVAKLAEQYGGGGHFDCAGVFLKNSTAVRKKFIRDAAKLIS